MTLNILYFGLVAEAVERSHEEIPFSKALSVKEVKNILKNKYTTIHKLDYQIAVDQKIVNEENQIINTSCEVAILPPFAGG